MPLCSRKKLNFNYSKLIAGEYVLQSDGRQPYWMPEIGLAIGAERQLYGTQEREWLFWYDQNNLRYPSSTERADIERKARLELEQKNEALRQRLAELGIDPDSV
jgi:hypothetical protein